MIVINKSGHLKYKNFTFRCALGKNGVSEKKKEGDKITPKGIYKIVNVYYRHDRIKKISSKLKLIKIKKIIMLQIMLIKMDHLTKRIRPHRVT